MSETIYLVLGFLFLLLLLPLAVRWMQRRAVLSAPEASVKVLSAVAVGPHQRVVTVEAGPPHARTWLVLGVTQQNVSCLYQAPALDQAAPAQHAAPLLGDQQPPEATPPTP